MLENYSARFKKGSKHIFVPNEECFRRGAEILDHVDATVNFPDFFYHYREGGHISALHGHLSQNYFFRIDLTNFFYSVSRSRIIEALRAIGFPKPRTSGKWSCVKNPYGTPTYSLPIGFIQSPALASICLMRSPAFSAIENARASGVFCSVYFDDFICSAVDPILLDQSFEDILAGCVAGGFSVNPDKLLLPAKTIVAFNCTLRNGFARVTEERVAKFFEKPRSAASEQGFERYRSLVEARNLTVST